MGGSVQDAVEHKGAGFDVETFDGYDSLATALEKRLPDLLLLDIMLDGTDGYQILKKLRDNAITATLPVIMLLLMCP